MLCGEKQSLQHTKAEHPLQPGAQLYRKDPDMTHPAGKKAVWINSGVPCYAQDQDPAHYKKAVQVLSLHALLHLSNWAMT